MELNLLCNKNKSLPYRQILLTETQFLSTEDRNTAALPNTRKTLTFLAKGPNLNYFFMAGQRCVRGRWGAGLCMLGKVCMGAGRGRRACFLKSD